MLFMLRAAGLGFLAALFLAPWWGMNASLDRLAGSGAAFAPLPTHEAADRVLRRFSVMKQEIRADMCRRGDDAICLMGLCLPDSCMDTGVDTGVDTGANTGAGATSPSAARRDRP